MSKDGETVATLSVGGVVLYLVALTFLLGDLMVITFHADHVDPGVRFRGGVFLLAFGSSLMLTGWLARRYAYVLASKK